MSASSSGAAGRPAAAAVLLGLAAAAAAADAPAPRELTLQAAIEAALEGNRDIQLTILSLESSHLALADARAKFQFTVRPELAADTRNDQSTRSAGLTVNRATPWGSSLAGGGARSQQLTDGAPDVQRGALRVSLEQPLLRRFGPLVNREPLTQAERQAITGRREVELKKTDVVVRVVETYEDLLSLQSQVEYERQTVERLERFFRLSAARERQGRGTRVDTLRAELKLGDARLSFSATDERLRSTRADFAELLGLPAGTAVTVLPGPRFEVADFEPAAGVAAAFSNRLDLAQIQQDLADAQRGVRIARRNLLPDLTAITRYERSGQGPDASDAGQLDTETWFVGISGSSDLPLRSERAALGQARISAESAALRAESVRAAIARQVEQAILAYRRAQAELPLADRNYQLARDRARLARRLFEMNKGDSFSVSDAEDARQQAERQQLAAQGASSVAACRLLRVLGTLIEYPPDLKPGAAP